MHFKHRVLSVVTIWLGAVGSGLAAQNHRVLIVDVLTEQGGTTSRLVVLEVESGKIIAEAETGEGPDIGISAQNDLVAVATFNRVGGRYLANDRMDIFASSDLRHLQKGVLPFGARIGFQRYAPLPTLAFSPDGKEIIVQRMESFLSDEKPFRWQVNNGLWGFVKRELDQEGTFKQSRPDVKVPRCRHADFLKVSDWPRVYIWNPNLAVVEGVDVNTGKILNRLPLDYDDDNALRVIAPEFLEKPAIGELYMHLGANGLVIPGGATYAYYIPRPTRNPEIQPGFIQKIDLGADPPKVVKKGNERQPNLWPPVSVVSEPGRALFVVVENAKGRFNGQLARQEKMGTSDQVSKRIRIYSTDDLKFLNEIEVSLPACDSLAASLDGKYLYALNRLQATISVIDIATGQEVKTLDKVGKFPTMIIPLPASNGGK